MAATRKRGNGQPCSARGHGLRPQILEPNLADPSRFPRARLASRSSPAPDRPRVRGHPSRQGVGVACGFDRGGRLRPPWRFVVSLRHPSPERSSASPCSAPSRNSAPRRPFHARQSIAPAQRGVQIPARQCHRVPGPYRPRGPAGASAPYPNLHAQSCVGSHRRHLAGGARARTARSTKWLCGGRSAGVGRARRSWASPHGAAAHRLTRAIARVAGPSRGAEQGLAPRASGQKERLGVSGLTRTLCYAHVRICALYEAHARASSCAMHIC